MAKIVFDPSTVAKSADVNSNFAGTWNGTLVDDEAISWRHLALTGAVFDFPGITPPAGWLLCDGSAVSRSTYSRLFGVISTRHGTGNGTTTFNLPDRRGRAAVGLDASQGEFNTVGLKGGASYVTLTEGQMPSHSHGVFDPGHAHGVFDPTHSHSTQGTYVRDVGGGGNITQTGAGSVWRNLQNVVVNGASSNIGIYSSGVGVSVNNTGSDEAHSVLQPYQVTNFYIKT